jgi:hypothetical protein
VLTWNPFIEAAPTTQEIADMQHRREALEIRSLLEFPALRLVMGLDAPTVVAHADHAGMTDEATVVELTSARALAVAGTEIVAGVGAPTRMRQPKRTPKAATPRTPKATAAPRANKGSATRTAARSTTHTAANQHPRFDRRALLESDRVA